MKRWIIPLGRGGTVLLAVGLALLLVSLIPAAQIGSFSDITTVYPERIITPSSGNILTPQQGLRLSVTANGTLNVYVLEVGVLTVYSWISEHYPGTADLWNATYFEEFLEANPESVGWQYEVQSGRIEYEYVPEKVTDATLVFSNPSSDIIQVEYEVSVTGYVAPTTKMSTLAQWTIPVGFLLTIPWLFYVLKAKTSRRGSQVLKQTT